LNVQSLLLWLNITTQKDESFHYQLSFLLGPRKLDAQKEFARYRFIGGWWADLPGKQRIVFETDFESNAGRIDLVRNEMAELKAPVSLSVESNLHSCLA
jgi:hypothetical protein